MQYYIKKLVIAKANALQKIMGQDGYVKGEGPLKH